MLDEASLRRLAEIGIDVYLPRVAAGSVATPAPNIETRATATDSSGQPVVLLLADASSSRAAALLAAVARALAFARVHSAQVATPDERSFAVARALVVFGDAQARAAGAVLTAQRQREIGWVVATEPSALAGDAHAKRALWSELKRIVRLLRTNGA